MTTDPTDVRRAIEARHDAFIRHANAGDIDRLVEEYYADEAHVLPPNAPLARGGAAIRELFRGFLGTGQNAFAPFEVVQVDAAGDLAYVVGKYSMTVRPPAGETVRDAGKFLEVWRRQADGSWRCAADAFSSDQASS